MNLGLLLQLFEDKEFSKKTKILSTAKKNISLPVAISNDTNSLSDLHHRCFDNCLQNIFQTNILENATGQLHLIVVLMLGLCFYN